MCVCACVTFFCFLSIYRAIQLTNENLSVVAGMKRGVFSCQDSSVCVCFRKLEESLLRKQPFLCRDLFCKNTKAKRVARADPPNDLPASCLLCLPPSRLHKMIDVDVDGHQHIYPRKEGGNNQPNEYLFLSWCFGHRFRPPPPRSHLSFATCSGLAATAVNKWLWLKVKLLLSPPLNVFFLVCMTIPASAGLPARTRVLLSVGTITL